MGGLCSLSTYQGVNASVSAAFAPYQMAQMNNRITTAVDGNNDIEGSRLIISSNKQGSSEISLEPQIGAIGRLPIIGSLTRLSFSVISFPFKVGYYVIEGVFAKAMSFLPKGVEAAEEHLTPFGRRVSLLRMRYENLYYAMQEIRQEIRQEILSLEKKANKTKATKQLIIDKFNDYIDLYNKKEILIERLTSLLLDKNPENDTRSLFGIKEMEELKAIAKKYGWQPNL